MAAVTSEEIQAAWKQVKSIAVLPDPPAPKLPVFHAKTPIKSRLSTIQAFITSLEYNYTGTLYFDVNKNRSFKSIVSTAKDIMKEVFPIQCLEAVFLASYLTASLAEVDRFPISFKSVAGSSIHRHIILAVRHQQTKWGALGLSRNEKLMYKDLKFSSLSELLQDYCREFENVYHKVVKIYVGFPFSHDIHSSEKVEWRVLNLPIELYNWTDMAQHFDTFAKEAADIVAFKRAKGTLPHSFASKFPLHIPEVEPGKKSPDKRIALNSTVSPMPPAPDTENSLDPMCPEKEVRKPSGPILVAPDQLVFKHALANTAQVLPNNIFLQNTTVSPFLIEVDEPSGQLEIVKPPRSKNGQHNDDNAVTTNGTKSDSVFRISGKGMIVIAIKYNPDQAAVNPTDTEYDSSIVKTQPVSSVTKAAPKTGKVNGTTKPSLPAILFRCTRLVNPQEDQANEVGEGETYVHELPFTIISV